MNKFKFYFILFFTTIILFSCSKDDDKEVAITPPKPYAEQYALDIVAIEDYLKTNYISEVVNHPGFPDDQDVTIKKITDAATQPSLYSYLNSTTLPRLTSRNVSLHSITYEVYTLVIREGVKGGSPEYGGEYPSNVDGVFAGYKGTLLDGTVFDSSNNGQSLSNLDGTEHDGGQGVIRGWSEGFPQFKTGWLSSKNDGTVGYNDFGVGVMFLPSGMGYYNQSQGKIPAYSPLVFSVKLYALKRYDHDADGILSYQEDLDGDRYMNRFLTGVSNPDDKDKDGIPNFLDADDDEDNYTTRFEITGSNGVLYPFASIPDCSGNTIDLDRTKKHLDKSCH